MRQFSALVVAVFFSHTLFATNGSNLIGTSPSGSALGGTGVAYSQSPVETLHKNPALLLDTEKMVAGKTAVELDVSLLKINTAATHSLSTATTTVAGSGGKENGLTRVFPQVGAAYQLSDRLAIGLGVISYAGTEADYTGQTQIQEQKTTVSISKIVPTLAFRTGSCLAVGISPVIGFGQFALNENLSLGTSPLVAATQSTRAPHADLALGVQLGAIANVTEGLKLGVGFISKTKYVFENLTDFEPFGGRAQDGLDNLNMEQPWEAALGLSYRLSDSLLLTSDYRFIAWRESDAFREFGWLNQHVIALGAQYTVSPSLRLRTGVNHNSGALEETTSGTTGSNTVSLSGKNIFQQSVSSLNTFSFPAVSKWHFTLGLGYGLTEDLDIDAAFVYAFKNTIARAGTTPSAGVSYNFSNTISQWSLGLGATWRL